MQILILGAGAVGGYFGGRLAAAGSDVTFLVRERRAAQLKSGLKIESPRGDATVPVRTILKGDTRRPFDVIIMSCKAYGLVGALRSIEPFVGRDTTIIPLLNGYVHLEMIEREFPSAIVCGGIAGVMATLAEDGTILQLRANQVITVGSRQHGAADPDTIENVVAEMKRADIDASVSPNIELAMWEKWTFLATLAAATCLMRCTIGEILATNHGEAIIAGLFDECNATASAEGYPPGPSPAQDYRSILFDRKSAVTASMLRDLESGNPTEADHILGDMIARAGRHGIEAPLLQTAYTHLQVYEGQRQR